MSTATDRIRKVVTQRLLDEEKAQAIVVKIAEHFQGSSSMTEDDFDLILANLIDPEGAES